jgi:hypothetical protein
MTVSLQNTAGILLTLLGLFPNLAVAQLSFGPIAGVAISTWRGADVRPAPDFRTGFAGGAFVRARIHKYFALEAQVLYARKGMEVTSTICSFPNTCQPLTVTWTQDYVEIPVLFSAVAPTRFAPTVFAGPTVAFQTSCMFRSSAGALRSAPCDSALAGPPPITMRRTDALLVFGGGFQLGQFALLARYDLGLTRFLVRQTTALDYKTRAWLISAGYRLSHRGR